MPDFIMPVFDLGPLAPTIIALAALACVIVAAGWDVTKFIIPDEISIILIILAAAYGLVTPGFGWLSHILSPLAVFAIGLVTFARGWMGGGDVKLLTALAAWSGHTGLFPLLTGTAIAGGVLAGTLIVARRARAGHPGPRVFEKDAPLPYAVAILGGVVWWAWIDWPFK